MNTNIFGLLDKNLGSKPLGAWHQKGLISNDRTAIVGDNYWCYIYEGSNDYRAAYLEQDQVSLGHTWATLIEERSKTCQHHGFNFLQVIVPNKLSLIPDYFPEKFKTDTTYILKELLATTINAPLLVPLNILRSDELKEYIFRRNDSHLTVIGNMLLTDLIIKHLGIENLVCPMPDFNEVTHIGDLGVKFEQPIAESLFVPNWTSGLLCQTQLKNVRNTIVSGFNGTIQAFLNPDALIDKKIVVFGNSFFEKVPSWGLSPYFAALFKEFHFVWSPAIDIQYCIDVEADIVIAQTCERFLGKLPTDKLTID